MKPINLYTRQEHLAVFDLYFQLKFEEMRTTNSTVQLYAKVIGRTDDSVRMKLYSIAKLDCEATRRGIISGLKPSGAVKEMWLWLHGDWEAFAIESGKALRELGLDASSEPPIQQGVVRQVSVAARDGQSFFRRIVHRIYGGACCITGMRIPSMLDAAHIVPWSQDSAHRCNPRNGLLLTSLHHRAFDDGLLTIDSDFRVKVSPAVMDDGSPFAAAAMLQYDGKPIHRPMPEYAPLQEFLERHRTKIFQS